MNICSNKYEALQVILDQKILAIFHGSSELGPRALGKRSFLFDPRNDNAKQIVNKVKKRENYRPFAATIMLEYAKEWFNMENINESPYMLYVFEPLSHKKDIIKSIIHVDNTCRLQTVTRKQNKFFYDLIKIFYEETKVPLLFNTSFNLAGAPLVETLEDAFKTIKNSKINNIYLPK
tara:strand:- start:1358 stop:1888 length:531 start_codon:yes stop_codon:yes gene_type:complete